MESRLHRPGRRRVAQRRARRGGARRAVDEVAVLGVTIDVRADERAQRHHRLGPVAREAQRRSAGYAARGDHRRSLAAAAPTIARSRTGQRFIGAAFWLMAPLAGMGKSWDPSDMIATLRGRGRLRRRRPAVRGPGPDAPDRRRPRPELRDGALPQDGGPDPRLPPHNLRGPRPRRHLHRPPLRPGHRLLPETGLRQRPKNLKARTWRVRSVAERPRRGRAESGGGAGACRQAVRRAAC